MKQEWERISLAAGFSSCVTSFPDRPALEIGDRVWRYRDLGGFANSLAHTLADLGGRDDCPVAILANRSLTAYGGILGALCSGRGFMPLNIYFPLVRSAAALETSGCDTIIAGAEGISHLESLLPLSPRPMMVLLPDTDKHRLVEKFPNHRFLDMRDLAGGNGPLTVVPVPASRIAYLLFTSGSTGKPKGVPVSHGNALAYLDGICRRYETNEYDRFSQFFEPTFDLHVHDLFLCWSKGSCLVPVPRKSLMAPASFIKNKNISVWFSVPSAAMFLARMRMLKANAFPHLRMSLFCGEALPLSVAERWQQAAPNSVVDNLYGPTEATIAISGYRFDRVSSPEECANGIVPIGWVFESQDHLLLNDQKQVVEGPGEGELCLSGSQVVSGYLNDPERTQRQFIEVPAKGERVWYRTGDQVRRKEDGCLQFLGRVDDQIQVRGYRVELQEVDHALRKAAGTEMAITIAWPMSMGRAEAIVGFVEGADDDERRRDILLGCCRRLPEYMAPRTLHFIHQIPINSNGKIDRNQLRERLRNES